MAWIRHLGRVTVDRGAVNAHGQHLAVAVINGPSFRRDREVDGATLFGHGRIVWSHDHLEIHQSQEEDGGDDQKEDAHIAHGARSGRGLASRFALHEPGQSRADARSRLRSPAGRVLAQAPVVCHGLLIRLVGNGALSCVSCTSTLI